MRNVIEMPRILLKRIACEIGVVDNSLPDQPRILQRQQDAQQGGLGKTQFTMNVVQPHAAGSLNELQNLDAARNGTYRLDPRSRHIILQSARRWKEVGGDAIARLQLLLHRACSSLKQNSANLMLPDHRASPAPSLTPPLRCSRRRTQRHRWRPLRWTKAVRPAPATDIRPATAATASDLPRSPKFRAETAARRRSMFRPVQSGTRRRTR